MNDSMYCNMVNEYIDDELHPDERNAFEQHLLECGACRQELEGLLALQYRITSLPRTLQPKHDLWDQIEASFHPQPQPLTSGLEERKNGKAVVLRLASRPQAFTRYLRVAAVVLLLAAAGVVWIIVETSRHQQTTAEHDALTLPSPNGEVPAAPKNLTISPEEPDRSVPVYSDRGREITKAPGKGRKLPLTKNPSGVPEGNSLAAREAESLQQRLQRGLELAPAPLQPSSAGKILGSVVDDRGQPVIGMTVELIGAHRSALTDAKGHFDFFGLMPSTYALEVRSVGYQLKVINDVKIIPGFTTQVNFQLTSGAASLGDIALDKEQYLAQSTTSPSPSELPSAVYVHPPLQWNKLTIEGKVVDEHGRAIVGAVVLVAGTRRGAYSDYEGKFHVYGVPTGTYTLQATADGYRAKDSTNVQVSCNIPIEVNIALDAKEER